MFFLRCKCNHQKHLFSNFFQLLQLSVQTMIIDDVLPKIS